MCLRAVLCAVEEATSEGELSVPVELGTFDLHGVLARESGAAVNGTSVSDIKLVCVGWAVHGWGTRDTNKPGMAAALLAPPSPVHRTPSHATQGSHLHYVCHMRPYQCIVRVTCHVCVACVACVACFVVCGLCASHSSCMSRLLCASRMCCVCVLRVSRVSRVMCVSCVSSMSRVPLV